MVDCDSSADPILRSRPRLLARAMAAGSTSAWVNARWPRRPVGSVDGERRRKLLELYYSDRISPDLFSEEEAHLSAAIEASATSVRTTGAGSSPERVRDRSGLVGCRGSGAPNPGRGLGRVGERLPRPLGSNCVGRSPLNVLYQEVGLKQSDFDGVGGPIDPLSTPGRPEVAALWARPGPRVPSRCCRRTRR